MKKFLIIDGYALIFRAFFAYPEHLSAPDGLPINALLGFYTLLLQAIDKIKPDYFCICLDHKDKSFRHDLFPDYKAKRESPPETLIVQLQRLRALLERSGLTFIEKSGYEADDLIGSLVNQDWVLDVDTSILTGDMDLLQLVSDKVSVLMPQRGAAPMKVMTPAAVEEKYGISPDQVIDYKALKGDTSDNIPGVRGVGDKTALTLLSKFKRLDALYASIPDAGSASLQKKLSEGKESAYLSKRLATICCDISIDLKQADCVYQPDWSEMLGMFKELAFQSLYRKYAEYAPQQQQKASGDYQLIKDEKDLKALLPKLKNGFAVDLETDSLSTLDANILGVAIAYQPHEGFYVALPKPDCDLFSQQTAPVCEGLLALLKPLLEDASIPKYAHHGKYEYQVLQRYGITLAGLDFDTLLAGYLLYPGQPLGLKDLVATHLDVEMTTYEDLVGKGKAAVALVDVPIEEVTAYACADADYTLQLKQFFEPLLEEKGLRPLFDDIEMPTQCVLAKMELEGVCIDRDYLSELEQQFDNKLQKIKNLIFSYASVPFNLNSPQQLAAFLYDELNLPVLKKTKTGRSTDASVLEKLQDKHACISELLTYRSLEKLQGTYVKALPTLLHPSDGRIHTSFNQTVVITGRLSSSSPNLQNIPIRSEDGHKIRRAFIPSRPENQILSLDYSQIELRVLAQLSQDRSMIAAFKEGRDIHQQTAALVFGCELDEVSKEQRYQAKAVNFGIIYGVSAFSLSQQLGVSNAEAKTIIEDYYAQFSTIKHFMDATIEDARKEGFVRTAFGRYRPLPEINASQVQRRHFAERTAVNTRIQGTAADVMKLAMIAVDRLLDENGFKSTLIIQVHDELVLDVWPEERDVLPERVKDCMQSVVAYDVPLDVDAVMGDNWQEIS